MMKDGSGRENVCEESVVAVDGEGDVLRSLGAGRVFHYEFGYVGALAADQAAADFSCGCVEGHTFGQWREAGACADGERVRRSAAGGDDGAAGVGLALRAAGACAGGDCQRAAGGCDGDFCRGGG